MKQRGCTESRASPNLNPHTIRELQLFRGRRRLGRLVDRDQRCAIRWKMLMIGIVNKHARSSSSSQNLLLGDNICGRETNCRSYAARASWNTSQADFKWLRQGMHARTHECIAYSKPQVFENTIKHAMTLKIVQVQRSSP